MLKIPRINKRAVCISLDNNYDLVKEISAYFRDEDTYFAVFKFLDLKEEKRDIAEFNEDGYLAQLLGVQNSTYIHNAIARIAPDHIIFAGISESQKSFFSGFSSKRVLSIDTVQDIEKYPKIFVKKTINVELDNYEQIVILEDEQDLSSIIAENLAFAMKARIEYVEKTQKHLDHKITNFMIEWKKKDRYSSYIKIENLVKNRVSHIDFTKYKYATFFTHGVPYGLVLNNPIPFCYVKKGLRDDIFIINNILYSQENFATVISFAIDQFLTSEPKRINEIFIRNNFHTISLFKEKATTFNFEHYASCLPYDILHISTHGTSKTNGYYVIDRFKDRDGTTHTLEYYEIPTFSISPFEKKDLIGVFIKKVFWKLDGARWMSKELEDKNLPKYVFEDMRKETMLRKTDGKNLKRTPVNDPIINASILECNDGQSHAQFHFLAAQTGPIIFNNSCWSGYDIVNSFVADGARAYIGTLWAIRDDVATQASCEFYEHILDKEECISDATWKINIDVANREDKQENIFQCWTLPFTRIQKNKVEYYDNFIETTLIIFIKWVRKIVTTKERDVRANTIRIVEFIIWVVKKEFGFDLISAQKDIVKEKIGYDLEEHKSVFTREKF